MQILTSLPPTLPADSICPQFSLYEPPLNAGKNRTPDATLTLDEVIAACKTVRMKNAVQQLRKMMPNSTAAEQQNFKLKAFPAFTPHGIFSMRNNAGWSTPSGLACIDIDHIPNPQDIKEKIIHDPLLGVVAAFISPRGEGLKVLVAVPLVASAESTVLRQHYADFYKGLREYFTNKYRLPWDASVEKISQACYLSYDPDAYIICDGASIHPFDPRPWMPSPSPKATRTDAETLEIIRNQIVDSRIDITADPMDWVYLAYAIYNIIGSSGLDTFLDISRFYPGFTAEEATKKFEDCSKGSPSGAPCRIGTILHICKKNGLKVDYSPKKCGNAEMRNCGNAENSKDYSSRRLSPELEIFRKAASAFGPTPDMIRPSIKYLPPFFQDLISRFEKPEQQDTVLLSAIIAMSAALPNYYGNYGDESVSCHLYCFITTGAAGKKGLMKTADYLLRPVEKYLQGINVANEKEYLRQVQECKEADTPSEDYPEKPPVFRLVIGGNSSAAKFNHMLSQNPKGLLIFETEGETLANTFKKDYGNFSDTFRKGFHHERIGSHLRNEDFEVEAPRIAALLSGTPDQISTLIPSPQNGLFSRFLFYALPGQNDWITQRPTTDVTSSLADIYYTMGEAKLLPLYQKLDKSATYYFKMTEEQWAQHDAIFAPLLRECGQDLGGLGASVKRLGLIMYRIAMILTMANYVDEELPCDHIITCSNEAFAAAYHVIRVCLMHAVSVYSTMKDQRPQKLPRREDLFLSLLPRDKEYGTAEWQEIAKNANIPARTAEAYHRRFVDSGIITRIKNGVFIISKKNK